MIHWLEKYAEQGVEGLVIQWAPGKPVRIPERLFTTIQSWIKGGPQSYGLDRANWIYEELVAHVYQSKGIDVKQTAMRHFCRHHATWLYRPTYRYLKSDHVAQQRVREELAS